MEREVAGTGQGRCQTMATRCRHVDVNCNTLTTWRRQLTTPCRHDAASLQQVDDTTMSESDIASVPFLPTRRLRCLYGRYKCVCSYSITVNQRMSLQHCLPLVTARWLPPKLLQKDPTKCEHYHTKHISNDEYTENIMLQKFSPTLLKNFIFIVRQGLQVTTSVSTFLKHVMSTIFCIHHLNTYNAMLLNHLNLEQQ